MTSIHPKTGGAAIGGALGTVIVTILGSFHGINLSDAANGAIPAFLATLGAWLFPSADSTGPTADEVAKAMLEQEAKK